MNLRDKLMIWIYNKQSRLDEESEQLRRFVHYHALDSLDHYEVMRDKIRIDAWNEFLREFFNIIQNCK